MNAPIIDKNYAGYVNLERIHALHIVKNKLTQWVILLSLIIFSGYIFNNESLYRPIPNGPATHELTLISILLISSALLFDQIKIRSKSTLFLASVASLISLTRLTEIYWGLDLISSITPYHEIAQTAQANGLSHFMALNTSLAILALSVSILIRPTFPRFSFVIGSVAPFLAFSSLAGYSFGQEDLHGGMSFLTISLILPLSGATLIQWAHYKFLRGFFLHTEVGKISRFPILLCLTVPWILGVIIIHLANVVDVYPFALYITGVSWFIIGMVIFGVILFEKIDGQRRTHERKVFKLSTTDNLTDSYNRHAGHNQGKYAFELAQRSNAPLSVMMFDVDNFKHINDTYGHSEGDDVLKTIAYKIKIGLRKADILVRWGGEEFVAILYDCSESDSVILAEKIRQKIQQTNFTLNDQSNIRMTVSVGCSSYTAQSTDFSDLLANADKAMYGAKNSGKNKVVAYSSLKPSNQDEF